MPKITVHGGPSNRHEPQPPQPRPGEGVFFQPVVPAVDSAPVEVPRTDGPEVLTGDGTGEALPAIDDADNSADTEPRLAAGDEPAASEDAPAQADTAPDTSEPAPKPRARKRTAAGTTSVEGS